MATPCPLLIATPVAFMGGMSSAAKLNVIIKDGGVLEVLARVRAVAFDKTGTLTEGKVDVVEIHPAARTVDETLQLAAAAEQYSVHVFADPIVASARTQQLELPEVVTADEVATNGVLASLADGTSVRVGKPSFIEEVTGPIDRPVLSAGETAVYVSVGDELSGVIILSDPMQPDPAPLSKRFLWSVSRGSARRPVHSCCTGQEKPKPPQLVPLHRGPSIASWVYQVNRAVTGSSARWGRQRTRLPETWAPSAQQRYPNLLVAAFGTGRASRGLIRCRPLGGLLKISQWNWIPSNIWVGVGRMPKKKVVFPLAPIYRRKHIVFYQARAEAI